MRKKLFFLCVCLLVGIGLANAQNLRKVSGVVTSSEDGLPIIGASVVVKGSTLGVTTDANGNFTLSVPASATTLQISYVGMTTQDVAIKAGKLKVVLNPVQKQLDEVVVVAYGTAKKQSLTGSISVVDSKKIENRISSNVTAALEGATPGVQVNNTYGEPGSAPSIRIRGFSSVNGSNSPLYVVDGVPFDGSINDLNPADVESVSILKDAASSALYGNRAANGVILITTKKGKITGKINVTFSANQGMFTRGIPEYDRMGADQWMETSWIGMKNYALSSAIKGITTPAQAGAYATAHLISDMAQRNIYDAADDKLFDENGKLIAKVLPGYDDLDWFKGVERTGHRQEYSATATTGNEKFNVFSSISYLKEDGYVINSGFERYTGRVNSQYTPTDWLKMGININATTQNSNYNSNANGSYYANPFYVCRYKAPIYPLYTHNADGTYALDVNGEKQFDVTSIYLGNRNIAYEMRHNIEKTNRNAIDGQAWGTISLPYGFDVTVKGNLSKSNSNTLKFDNPTIGDGAGDNKGRLTQGAYQYRTYNFQQQLTWDRDFGMHHVDVLFGHENYGFKQNYTSGMNTVMAVEGLIVMGNFTKNSYFNGADDEYNTESYLSRLRYNYNEKYFFDASFRRDGSSRFYKDNRWGNFFSFGASWNMKKEQFLKDIKWVDALKLRASYGEVGNDAGVGFYGYMATYELDKNAGNGSLIKKTLQSNDIKWETTQTIDVAAEGRLFDRLNFSVGYFDKRSKDLLFAVKLPLSAGSFPHDDGNENLTINQNIGTVSNRGIELSLDYDVIRTDKMTLNVGADATFLKNKVVKLPGGKDILHGIEKYSEGHSMYEFFTYHFEGVDQMTGNSLYTLSSDENQIALAKEKGKLVSINGKDYTTDTTYGEKVWAGSALPSVYGSFHANFSYKNFSAGMLFTYSLGGKTYDSAYASLMSTSPQTASAYHKDLVKSWSAAPANMTETSSDRIWKDGIPVIDHNLSTYNNTTSDRWLTSSSYLVFKNINMSYTLPQSWYSRLGIAGLTFTAGVENVFSLTSRKGLNPQYSYAGTQDNTYTTARVYNFGLKVSF